LSFAASFLVTDTSSLTSRITLNRLAVAVSCYTVQRMFDFDFFDVIFAQNLVLSCKL